jgi:hypothetical protein
MTNNPQSPDLTITPPASKQDKKWYLGKIADWQLSITRSEGVPRFVRYLTTLKMVSYLLVRTLME